jgi:hypothetical protein
MAFESLRIFPSEEYSNRNHCHTLWPFLGELTKVVSDVHQLHRFWQIVLLKINWYGILTSALVS